MRFSRYVKQIVGAQTEARWLRWFAIGLLCANLLLAVGVFTTKTVVTIQPPGMNEAVQVTKNQADGAYKRGWGLFVANLLGNVKPGNAKFIIETLTPLLSPGLYRPIVDAIEEQAQTIDRDKIAAEFTAREVIYDPRANRVYVHGRQTSSGPGSSPVTRPRTYEFEISVKNYKPMISHFDIYPERPRIKE